MPEAVVDITTSGRGGTIYYREGRKVVPFDWEFGGGDALAIVIGPKAEQWDVAYPWARGRQAAIFEFVATEVVRQQAPNHRVELDLHNGFITILETTTNSSSSSTYTAAYDRFLASMVPPWAHWAEGQSYDLGAIEEMTASEREEIMTLLNSRDITWREVEVFAAIKSPAAREALEAASKHHLSIDTRLAAAAAMHADQHTPNIDAFIARQLRLLSNPAEGMRRALAMAAEHPSEAVKQALLWASYNATECAPHCARLLIKLNGTAAEPQDAETEQVLAHLGMHNSYFDREAAFIKLSALVGMQLERGQGD